ncbi:hypothetical protein D3C85_1325740 [compost metagenome]
MLERHVGGQQRMLERERATDGEGHEVVTPQLGDAGGLVVLGAVAIDAVHRHIGADIDIHAQVPEDRVARIGHVDHRAGLAVQRAELEEVIGPVARQDHDIGLHVAPRQAAGVATVAALANDAAQCGGVVGQDRGGVLERLVHGCGVGIG